MFQPRSSALLIIITVIIFLVGLYFTSIISEKSHLNFARLLPIETFYNKILVRPTPFRLYDLCGARKPSEFNFQPLLKKTTRFLPDQLVPPLLERVLVHEALGSACPAPVARNLKPTMIVVSELSYTLMCRLVAESVNVAA